LRGVVLCLLDAFDGVLVEPFVANGAVASLDIGVLLGLALVAHCRDLLLDKEGIFTRSRIARSTATAA
jgi:hypothetical protein